MCVCACINIYIYILTLLLLSLLLKGLEHQACRLLVVFRGTASSECEHEHDIQKRSCLEAFERDLEECEDAWSSRIMLLWMVAVADGKMMDRRHQCQIFGAWVPNLWCMLPRNASNLLAGWKEPKTPKFEWPSRNKSLPSSASKVPEALSQHSFERSSKSFHNPSNIVPTLGSHFGKIRRCEIFFDK